MTLAYGRHLGVIAAAALVASAALAADDSALEIGILPALSARGVIASHQPMREYLESRLGRPVRLVTAPDYMTHIERVRAREYAILATSPHIARLAQQDYGYIPLVRARAEVHGLIVVRADSGIASLRELAGHTIATPGSLALTSMMGLQLLRERGLDPGRDVILHPSASFTSALLGVESGEDTAAMTVAAAMSQLPEASRTRLRVIDTMRPVPGTFYYLAQPGTPPAEVARLTQLLLDFSNDSHRSAEFFAMTGFGALVRPTPADLQAFDPYAAELRRQLSARRK